MYLALATGSALRGDTAGFNAWATALNGPTDSNSADIIEAVRSAYGDEVGTAFDDGGGAKTTSRHSSPTQAVAKNDTTAKDKAVADLQAYARTFGETLIAVIEAQKAKDATAAATALREAAHHMSATARVLAEATVAKFPEKF